MRIAADKKDVILTGVREVDEKLGGGIPVGSLGLIDRISVAYYTTENTVRSLIAQMDSLSLFTLDYFLTDYFRIYPLTLRADMADTEKPFRFLKRHFAGLPRQFGLILVDSITLIVAHSNPVSIVDFFSACKDLSDMGRSIFLVAHSYAFDEEVLSRTRSLCDAHLKIRLEQMGDRLVKIMEVLKVRGADQRTGDAVGFEVEPKKGMHIIPLSRARV